ncbi:hypothetical protein Dimus_035606, partial [Dionaea muscipula]
MGCVLGRKLACFNCLHQLLSAAMHELRAAAAASCWMYRVSIAPSFACTLLWGLWFSRYTLLHFGLKEDATYCCLMHGPFKSLIGFIMVLRSPHALLK